MLLFVPTFSLLLKHVTLLFLIFVTLGCNPVSLYIEPFLTEPSPRFQIEQTEELLLEVTSDASLRTLVYQPKGLSKAPSVLIRAPLPSDFMTGLKVDAISKYLASFGFNVVVQGLRGTFGSTGTYIPLVNERHDGLITFNWLKNQPFYNGEFAMWGGSVFGYTQLIIGDVQAKQSAFAVQIACSEPKEVFYPEGVLALSSAVYWAAKDKRNDPKVLDLEKAMHSLPAMEVDNATFGQTAYYDYWIERDSVYWSKVRGREMLNNLSGPTLMLAGWYDAFLPCQLRDFSKISDMDAHSYLVIGPYAHATTISFPGDSKEKPYRIAALNDVGEWFKKVFEGAPDKGSPKKVKFFTMGAGIWQEADTWPPADSRSKKFYLRDFSSNKEGRTKEIRYDPAEPTPSVGGFALGPWSGPKDQSQAEGSEDVLLFTSKVFGADTELTGNISATLWVDSRSGSSDFIVNLSVVDEHGLSTIISEGLTRVKQLKTRPAKLKIEMRPTSVLVKQGEKLRVKISGSSFPRFNKQLSSSLSEVIISKPYESYIELGFRP